MSRSSDESDSSSTGAGASYYTLYHGGSQKGLERIMKCKYNEGRTGGEIDFTAGIYFTTDPKQAMDWSMRSEDKHRNVVEMLVPHEPDIYTDMVTLLFVPEDWCDETDDFPLMETHVDNSYKYICTSSDGLRAMVKACRKKDDPPAVAVQAFNGKDVLKQEDWLNIEAVEGPLCPNPTSTSFNGHQIFFASYSKILERCEKRILTEKDMQL
eukprot:TRINITY_DN81188_c0_g1_i1.p1 TRINITY_DN81188_c0_g1~~TRINITY_DN81188_c0_g1_i1.p1  ORF type:complete len:211 (+),score=38.56 TRINITY_DN81188_c0_g1_i1:57-689(+)